MPDVRPVTPEAKWNIKGQPGCTGEDEVVDEDRDREFEERRLKIEREQELIYEQEEQHFREVVNIILNDKRDQSVFKLSQNLFSQSKTLSLNP